ncbi:MAG: type II toxin-antitoxin system RelE/ParE family toxin [Proteobacteria bacterium]|nr:type II toxin-antitoxin system RelE/ParE family toxin [Pseudomonadota bacterium]
MDEWSFKIYGTNESDVDAWIEGLSPKAMARMDVIINHLRVTRVWGRPYIAALKIHSGIYEIIFTVQNIQYRPLGCYGPNDKEFTILTGATEKGNKFNPLNAPLKAEKRRKDIFQGREGVHDHNP